MGVTSGSRAITVERKEFSAEHSQHAKRAEHFGGGSGVIDESKACTADLKITEKINQIH